jgi:hypothetical protein
MQEHKRINRAYLSAHKKEPRRAWSGFNVSRWFGPLDISPIVRYPAKWRRLKALSLAT